MSDNKASILAYIISIFVIGFVIDAFLPAILQETNLAIQSANGNLFQNSVVGLLVVVPIIVIGGIVLLKWDEIRGMF